MVVHIFAVSHFYGEVGAVTMLMRAELKVDLATVVNAHQ